MGFEDYLNQGGTLILEWPDLLADDRFEHKLEVTLSSEIEAPDQQSCWRPRIEIIAILTGI